LPAIRNAVMFQTAYAFGLRRTETRMLDLADFGRNPHVSEFGSLGVCHVRFGKAMKSSHRFVSLPGSSTELPVLADQRPSLA
jgi:integrase/recombinase XerC